MSRTSLNNLALLYRAQGKVDEALALTRRANASLARRFTADSGASRRGALAEQRTHSGEFEFHVSLLAAVAERGPQVRAEATREGFGIAQLARASDTAEQVAKMAARYAAGSDALAQLARARQDAMARFEQLDSRIVQAAGQRGAEATRGETARRAGRDNEGDHRTRCAPGARVSAVRGTDQPEAAGTCRCAEAAGRGRSARAAARLGG